MTPGWLAKRLEDPRIRVIDIRGAVTTEDLGGGRQRSSYAGLLDAFHSAHIPGSVFVDWTQDIVDPAATVKVQIAEPAQFSELMGKLGVSDETVVIAVDQTGGHLATRLWWALRYYGHLAVAVLDGGFNAWLAHGLPTESGSARAPEPGTFTAIPQPSLRSTAEEVRALIDGGERQIVDARDRGTYEGSVQRGSRGGHIPTAINLPSSEFQNQDGTWREPEAIRAAAEAAGVDFNRPVTAYCNGGVTATALLFGLQLAGMQDVSNYDGSWNEWGERHDLPVEGNRDLFGDTTR